MSLRKVDISRLMDAYEDTEFLPKEEILVNTEHIKQEVIRAVKAKRRTVKKTALVAAALAACLALAGWGYGGKIFDFLSGGHVSVGGQGGDIIGSATVVMSDGLDDSGRLTIIALEEGRLWFVATGERIDVTDLVDEATPYVWTRWLEDGSLHYIIVGGTPEDYGWCEGVKFPDGSGGGSGTLHSREDIPWEEFIQDPDWYGAGLSQEEELFEE